MDAWIPVIGTIAGAIVGGMIAAFISFREQQREPKLILLEKRIDARAKLFKGLYEITTCILQNAHPERTIKYIDNFRSFFLDGVLYIDIKTRTQIIPIYNYLMSVLDTKEIKMDEFKPLADKANRSLLGDINISYT